MPAIVYRGTDCTLHAVDGAVTLRATAAERGARPVHVDVSFTPEEALAAAQHLAAAAQRLLPPPPLPEPAGAIESEPDPEKGVAVDPVDPVAGTGLTPLPELRRRFTGG